MKTFIEPTLSYPEPAIAILGVPFDPVNMSDALETIGKMVASRRPHYVVTANVDFLAQARLDVELRRILLDAHLVLCDGTPVLWASKLLGNPLPERVAGADLVPKLIQIAAEKQLRVFFLGGTPESMARAMANVKTKFPQLQAEGFSPPFNHLLEMDHEEIKRRIRAARPDLLFVSFGCPKQEKWMAMHYQSLGVPVSIGVGGTIDFLAGQLKRAPKWMQRTGTEWIFRLLQEPKRLFRRYARDMKMFGTLLLAQWWTMGRRKKVSITSASRREPRQVNAREKNRIGKRRVITCGFARLRRFATMRPLHHELKKNGTVSSRINAAADWQWIQLPNRLDASAVRNDALLCDPILADGRHCLLQMERVNFIDSTGLGWLLRLQKKLRATRRHLILIAPGAVVKRVLALMNLEDFFATAPSFEAAQELIEELSSEQHEWVDSDNSMNSNNAPLVSWRGEITAANAAPVWERTEELMSLQTGSAQPVVIDLSQVRFMDSSGLGLMVRARKLAEKSGLSLDFARPQSAVLNVLRLARMESLLAASGREKPRAFELNNAPA